MEKIRILDHSWHLAHQYDQIKATKDFIDWSWLIQHRRGFNTMPRGNFLKEFEVKEVPFYRKGDYDLAILHLDQQCLNEGILKNGKGRLFRELKETITDIPKLVICHGTPYWPETMTDTQTCQEMANLIGNNWVLVNSYEARLQWAYGIEKARMIKIRCKNEGIDWKIISKKQVKDIFGFETIGIDIDKIRTIWHGISKDDFLYLPKEPRVITMIANDGLSDSYYGRQFLRSVKDALSEKDISLCHITVDASFKNFDEYSNFVSRSLIYLNPTKESPMPRSRTEAMLSGACVLTTRYQDAEDFIKNGENGFVIPEKTEKVVELIMALLSEYNTAVEIGKKGRETAIELFNPERYKNEFLGLISDIISSYNA
jgi:glycosyltransferase involved in cell wall biosynthesis